jgi:hypothetical protein
VAVSVPVVGPDDRVLMTMWKKQCACVDASATTGRVYFREEMDRKAGAPVVVMMEFIPGPSCDECGMAWELVETVQ